MDEGEVDAILANIPSDGESDDGLTIDEDEEMDISTQDITTECLSNSSESEEENEDLPLSYLVPMDKFLWKKPTTVSSDCFSINNFTENVGPVNVPDDKESPIDIFECLIDKNIIENIVFQTNLYATQREKPFMPTHETEIKIFLAINILMGVKKLPSYRDFWSSDAMLRDHYISNQMTRTRFDWLLGNFHLNNNVLQPSRQSPDFDKLYKLRPFLNGISHNFTSFYKLHNTISIDESMICFKGRSSIRQYMPNKPIKWGYKVWTRADASGYIDEFQIYTGKVNGNAEKQLGPRVIKDLTRSLVGKNYFVYFDNFFTSLPLLRELKKDNINATGTIRKGRKGIPGDLKPEKTMKQGDYDWRITDDGISLVKWMDKRIVLLASNHENPSETTYVARKKKNGEKEDVACPIMLKNYNQNMGFVDKADMLKKTYEIDRKSQKWWPRIFWHFIDVSIVNAFIIFQQRCNGNSGMNLKAFRLSIVAGLVGAGREKCPPTKKKQSSLGKEGNMANNYKPIVPLEKRWDQALHMPVYGTYRRCALCSTLDHQRRSKWACETCGVALCLSDKKDCFQKFHKKN